VRGSLGSAGKGRGGGGVGIGSPKVPFCGSLAAEEQPAMVLRGTVGRRPPGGELSAGAETGRRGATSAEQGGKG
jgi:hypothetical protein